MRLETLWPFPKKLAEKASKIIVPEMNIRQLFWEVERVAEGKAKVIPLNNIGGGELITPEEITNKILEEAEKGNG